MDAFIAAKMAAQHIPGLSYAVIRNGEVVRSGVRGLSNVELNVPVTDATEFAIASMSKSVTASAVLLLAQDARLALDDRVRKYLPDVPASWDEMTIRHLLSHTAGVKDHFRDSPAYPTLAGFDRHVAYSDQDYVKAHVDAPLNFAPGAGWAYSGGGYVILGAIIQKVTGRPYGDYLRDRVFRPLGMDHTHIISNAEIIPNRAAGYWYRDGRLRNGEPTSQAALGGPDVGVMTTATDLAKWVIAISGNGPWTEASRTAMWTATTLNDGRDTAGYPSGYGYGLGWLVTTHRGYRLVGHAGTLVNGFTSTFVVLPEKQTAVIVLTNQYDAQPQPIALGLAGSYDPELVPPSEMRAEQDPDPPATARVHDFMAAVLRGGDVSQWATPQLVRHLSAMWHPPPGAPAPDAPVTFISRADVRRRIERFGSVVTRLAFYKIHVQGDDHWLTVLLTADGRIAAYEAY